MGRGDIRVSEDECQRGGHARLNHAGTFGHSGETDGTAAQRDFGMRFLGNQIGGEDGARHAFESGSGQTERAVPEACR